MRKNRDSGVISLYAELIKVRLSLAVTFSAVTGYFISHNFIEIRFFFLVAGVFLLASGASAVNQYSEIRYDSLMRRTMERPLPQEEISPKSALFFAACLFCIGLVLLLLAGAVPLCLGILNVILYNIVYTKLKRVTPWAILPGALVGAMPPLIGFEAAGGGAHVSEIVLFSGFMLFWQLPHFWLILLKYHKEYEAAGFVTFSRFASENQIRWLVFIWVFFTTTLLLVFSLAGLIFNRQITTFLIPLNIAFIFVFYYLLFRKSYMKEFRGAFFLINLFNLAIMILFIINSFLS
jgi:heme o synthase